MKKMLISTLLAAVVLALAVPGWAQSAPKNQKVVIQNAPTLDGDTGGGTQPVTLFGIALPASGGVVFGGTATNPFIVSGTVAATQSGTWTMQPGNAPNTTPWLFSISQGGNTAAVNASSQLSVNCANCTGSGVSQQDNTGYTAGTTNMVPVAGFVGSTSVTSGNAGALQMTTDRMLFTNLGKVGGTAFALGQTTMSASLPVTLANNQSTLPVSLASVPSHAVTNAGTFATQIDGSALTALQLIDNIVNTIGSTTSGSSGVLGLCAATTSAPTYTTGQNHPCSIQTDGSLRVYLTGASNGSVSNDDDGQIADGGTNHTTVLPLTYAWNSDSGVADWTRFMHQPLDFDSGAGTENLSVIGIGLPASGGPVIGGTSANPFRTDPTGTTTQPVSATSLPLPTGAATEATLANILTSANFAAAFGTAGSADAQVMSIQGIASMTPVQVQSNSANLATQTTLASILTAVELIDNDQTGASLHHRISTGATEDEHEVKGSAGRLFAINVTNTNAAVRYLRCANQVIGSTTPGTTGVFYGMAIPAATTGAGYTAVFGPKGIAFSTGLTCWLVTGAAETDVAEVAANEINVNYVYE